MSDTPARSDTPVRPWSLLAYTIADDYGSGNPLDDALRIELKAMCDAADFRRLSIAAQVDFKELRGVFRTAVVAPPPTSRDTFKDASPARSPIWRGIVKKVEGQVDFKRKKTDSNSAQGTVFRGFLSYGVKQCPAERYALLMYGHGSGPMGLFYDRDPSGQTARTLRLNAFGTAVRAAGRPVDIVMFRDCYMDTIETAFELRGTVRYMIASQSEVPIAGVWPWQEMMQTLMTRPQASDVGLALVRQLGEHFDHPGNRSPFDNAPISLVDTDKTEAIAPVLKAIADELDAARRDRERMKQCGVAINHARVGRNTHENPGDPALLDLPTLCDGLMRLDDPVAGPAAALCEMLPGRLVLFHHAQHTDAHRGISIYCEPHDPELRRISNMVSAGALLGSDRTYYRQLTLCQETGWDRIALQPLVEPHTGA